LWQNSGNRSRSEQLLAPSQTPDPQNNFGSYAYYDQCLASICSLLGTTNPPHVVVLVDARFPPHARATLQVRIPEAAQGIQTAT
jgi:hypothetical protein